MTDHTKDDLAVRVARAEIERDAALAKVEELGRALQAWTSQDKEKLLDTLRIIGIPARDLADIYRLEQEWRMRGGNERLLADLREREALKDRVRELERERDGAIPPFVISDPTCSPIRRAPWDPRFWQRKAKLRRV